MKKRGKIITIILSVWILVGSLYGGIPGIKENIVQVQASATQQLDANNNRMVGEDRVLLIQSDADLQSWLNYKETGAQEVVQSISHIQISGITHIPDGAFANMENLNKVTFNMSTPPTFGKQVFYGEESRIVHFYVPSEAIDAYDRILSTVDASGWKQLGHSAFYVRDIFHTSLHGGNAVETSTEQTHSNYIHTHTWIQKEYIKATATEDATVFSFCEGCGIMGSYTKRPGSAHLKFLLDTAEQIINAPQDASVTATTEIWLSMNRLITDALQTRNDVSLTINYKYKSKYYTLTIPAGYDGENLLHENDWAGFRYVDSILPGKELTREEWKMSK